METNNINKNCVCKNLNCPRHGNCKTCQEHHKGGLTSCKKTSSK